MSLVSKKVFQSLLIGMVVGGALAFIFTSKESIEIQGVVTYEVKDRSHVAGNVEYPQTPPVGGAHNAQWLACNSAVYTTPVANENAVHSLEHGAVWITYRADVSGEDVALLEKKVSDYTFMSPYPTQPGAIMLTAWGLQLTVDSPIDSRIDDFLATYRQGKQTPEPGATCAVLPVSL